MEVLEQFILHCHNNLIKENNEEIEKARKYLKEERNLLDSALATHKIGYCCSNEIIPDEIRFFGINHDKQCDCLSFIRGRIIVPIREEFGDFISLATRKPSSVGKNSWWNLPHPFQKGHHLFLLDKARQNMFLQNKVYIVEGYMDAITLNQFGIKNVVGLMGTSLTIRKIGLIARYCNNVCVCLDVDENNAGQNAKDRCICDLKSFEFCDSISVIDNLPVGVDPDEYIAESGKEKFLSLEKELSLQEIKKICRNVKTIKKKAK